MEAELDQAERRRDRERKEAERQRKIKAERETYGRRIAEEAEKKRLAAIREQQEREFLKREREEEELRSSGGINVTTFLKPIPLANLETDRVRLPPSILEMLINKGAINDDGNKVITFELALFQDDVTVVSKTHCGVLEFTAQEGTIEIPIKAAMSLSKDFGETVLSTWRLRVRYVVLDKFEKIRTKIQPLGEGFHTEGVETANIDLKTVLQRALSSQTTLTEGDRIPIRHEGKTYVLAVRELQPDTQALLINTDVEIDLLPSEEVMKKQIQEENKKSEQLKRKAYAKSLEESLPMEPTLNGPNVLTIRARLPESQVATRKFTDDTRLSIIFQWAESKLGDLERPSINELEIIQSFRPGQSVTLGKDKGQMTLKELGFSRAEVLNFRWKAEEEEKKQESEEVKTKHQLMEVEKTEDWTASKASAESHLDKNLEQEYQQQRQEEEEEDNLSATDMFKLLISKGAEPTSAARICQKFLPILRTLKNLSLLDAPFSGKKAVELIEKFKGSSGRIVDAMFAEEFMETEKVVNNNNGTPSLTTKNEEEREQEGSSGWGDKLAILESMFHGRDRNELVSALDKHRGSIERAVNELLSSS